MARFLNAGDTALTIELGDRADPGISADVVALARRIEAAQLAGVVEVVPTIRSLTLHYDPCRTSCAALEAVAATADLGREPAPCSGLAAAPLGNPGLLRCGAGA